MDLPRRLVPLAAALTVGLTACGSDGTAPSPVADIVVTPGTALLSSLGATRAFSARAVDAGGATIGDVSVAWSSSSPAIVRIDANGVATSVSEGTAIVRAVAGEAEGSATVTVDVVPADIEALAGDGQSAQVGSELPQAVVVEVHDTRGSRVAGKRVTFTPSGAGLADPGSVTTDAEGRATTRWTLGGLAGGHVLTVRAGPASREISATALAAPASRMAATRGDGQAGNPGSELDDSLEVRVTDAFGNGIPDVAVHFDASAGTVSPPVGTTDGEGRTRTDVVLPDEEGPVTVTASAEGLPAVTFALTSRLQPLGIATGGLGRARRTLPYADTVRAQGGRGSSYVFQLVGGALPGGLTLSSGGAVEGVPTQEGAFGFKVEVRDDLGERATEELELTVCEAPVSLAPGGVWTGEPKAAADSCGLFLPSGDAGSRYRVAVVRPTQTTGGGDVADVTFRVDGDGVIAGPAPVTSGAKIQPFLPELSPLDQLAVNRGLATAEATARAHARMRGEEARLFQRLGAGPVLPDLRGPARTPAAASTLPAKLRLDTSTSSDCEAGTTVTAVKLAEDERLAIYQDSVQNTRASQAVTPAQARMMLEFYRDYGKSVIDGYFGGVSDIDGNGKVIVFISPMVGGNVAAFVWSGDFYDKASCPASNRGEFVYFNAAVVGDLGVQPGQALATLVHEMKHVSSLYQRLQRSKTQGSDQSQPLWVEEGTAEIASEMASRLAWQAAGGPAPGAVATAEDIRSTGVDDRNYGIVLKLYRTQESLSSQPNGIIVTPNGAKPGASIYGTGWLFHRWLGDAYGGAATAPLADAPFFRTLNRASTPSGIAGLAEVTGRSWTRLMEEFAAAAMANGRATVQPDRAFATYDFVSIIEIFCFALDPVRFEDSSCQAQGTTSPGPPGAFPWPVTVDDQGVSESVGLGDAVFQGAIGSSGIRVYDFLSNGTGNGAEIHVQGPSPTRLVVVRLN